MKAQAVQYTVRGVPENVDRILRERALREHLSVNQVILDVLTSATIGRKQVADFTDLVGKWTEDAAFDETLAAQRQIDLDDWK